MGTHFSHWSLPVPHHFPFPQFPKNIVPVSVMSTPLPQTTSDRFPTRSFSIFPNPRCLWVMVRVLLRWEQHWMLLVSDGKSQEKPEVCDSEFGTLGLI